MTFFRFVVLVILKWRGTAATPLLAMKDNGGTLYWNWTLLAIRTCLDAFPMKCNLERKEYVQVSTISARCLWNVLGQWRFGRLPTTKKWLQDMAKEVDGEKMLVCIVWYIWEERNLLVFENHSSEAADCMAWYLAWFQEYDSENRNMARAT